LLLLLLVAMRTAAATAAAASLPRWQCQGQQQQQQLQAITGSSLMAVVAAWLQMHMTMMTQPRRSVTRRLCGSSAWTQWQQQG
jgi:ABC-type proline/glycine betaine transport system permease subunit